MYKRFVICIATLLLAPRLFAQTNNVLIPITGTAYINPDTLGNFSIGGPHLFLDQGLPNGNPDIGFCDVGTVCNLTVTISSAATFCSYCTGYSSGIFDHRVADFLDPQLTFTGSAFYSGGSTLLMRMKFSGTIVGYKLVDCTDGVECSLGPVEFALSVSGKALATLSFDGTGIYSVSMRLMGGAIPHSSN